MSNLSRVANQKSDHIGEHYALQMNIRAAEGLADVMKSNLGPKGTVKMLVSGSGDIKLTKDGAVLLNQMVSGRCVAPMRG